jgi:hypothetical protein
MVPWKNGEFPNALAIRDSAIIDIPLVRNSLRFINQNLQKY